MCSTKCAAQNADHKLMVTHDIKQKYAAQGLPSKKCLGSLLTATRDQFCPQSPGHGHILPRYKVQIFSPLLCSAGLGRT